MNEISENDFPGGYVQNMGHWDKQGPVPNPENLELILTIINKLIREQKEIRRLMMELHKGET